MEKSVTFTLSTITVLSEGDTKEAILENAKKALIAQIEKQFPPFSYAIDDLDILTFTTVKCGMIVETKDGKTGIVTAINKKTINVALKGQSAVKGPPQAFRVSTATFEDVRNKREEYMQDDWYEGDTGYLKVKEDFLEVVIGKKAGSKYKAYIVNGDGSHYPLTSQHVEAFLKEERDMWEVK